MYQRLRCYLATTPPDTAPQPEPGRFDWAYDTAVLLAGMAVTNFFFHMDEPFFELSELSMIHAATLGFALLVTVNDLRVRARHGQWAPKDHAVMNGALSYWLTLERYTAAILTVSGLHFLLPLEAELFDMVDVSCALFMWAATALVVPLFVGLFILFLTYMVAAAVSWARPALLILLSSVATLSLVAVWALLGLDLAFGAFGGAAGLADVGAFYVQPRVGHAFDAVEGAVDVFDWHRSYPTARPVRFIDLYTFSLTLIAFLAVTVSLFWWAALTLDLGLHGVSGLTPEVIGVALRLADHLLLSLSWGYLSVGLVAVRVLFRIPLDEFFW
jgi:hypothetical protein